jgi:hypothetical protein
MPKINCWKAASADNDQARWNQTAAPPCLRLCGRNLVLELPPGRRGFVNGLPVIGGIHVVRKGALIRIQGPEESEMTFVVAGIQVETEPGKGRQCQFCGLPIRGQALVCACGAVYCTCCGDPHREEARCTICREPLVVDAEPPSEALL